MAVRAAGGASGSGLAHAALGREYCPAARKMRCASDAAPPIIGQDAHPGRVDMRRLLTLAAVSLGVLALCAPASAAPLSDRRIEHGERCESVRAGLRWTGRGGADERQLSQRRGGVAYRGRSDGRRTRSPGPGSRIGGTTAARTATCTPTRPTAARRGRRARRASRAARVAPRPAPCRQPRGRRGPATTSGRRTRGCPTGRMVACTRLRSCLTTRRRVTRCWPPTPTMTARPGALRASCASTIRARSATTSTTRRP